MKRKSCQKFIKHFTKFEQRSTVITFWPTFFKNVDSYVYTARGDTIKWQNAKKPSFQRWKEVMFYPLFIIPVSVQFLQWKFKETLNMGGVCLTKNCGTFKTSANGLEKSLAIFRKIQKLPKCPKILFPGRKLNGKAILDKKFSDILVAHEARKVGFFQRLL